MNIGSKIKQLRKAKDLTQEQLAEYLNVSISAVSQWESGKTLPDISLILPLANFFDVTTDTLFGRCEQAKEEIIAEYDQKSSEYGNRGDVRAKLALWREAAEQYPGDFHVLSMLAHSLYSTVRAPGDQDAKGENARECVTVCERILRDCTESSPRGTAIQLLTLLYGNARLPFADEDTAVKYASMGDSIYVSHEILLEHAYFTEENKQKKIGQQHHNTLTFMDILTRYIVQPWYAPPEEGIEGNKRAIALWETLIEDGNYLFYHCRLAAFYRGLAYQYAKLQDRENVLSSLRSALYHAKRYDEQPEGEQHYTAKFVCQATSNRAKTSKNFTSTEVRLVLSDMQNIIYDFLRDDPDFAALAEI